MLNLSFLVCGAGERISADEPTRLNYRTFRPAGFGGRTDGFVVGTELDAPKQKGPDDIDFTGSPSSPKRLSYLDWRGRHASPPRRAGDYWANRVYIYIYI